MGEGISLVITCFREGKLIYDGIQSIKNQTLQPREIIIVNDASPDEATNEVCRILEKDNIIKVVWCENNGGPSLARNKGFQVAQGEILVPLDADDTLPDKALEFINNTFTQHPETGFVYGDYLRQDKIDKPGYRVNPGDISLATMLRAKKFSISSNWKLLGTTPLRRSLWQSLAGYDPEFGTKDLHDVEFWIRVLASGCKYYYIPEVIYTWRKYLGSNSAKVTPASWQRIVNKYFSTYEELNLSYRAYELLLLNSKWNDNEEEIAQYSSALKKHIISGNFQLSSLLILAFPASILKMLTNIARKSR